MTQEERRIIIAALAEDTAMGDPTTAATISPDSIGKAFFLAKADGVLAGIEIACETFKLFAESSGREKEVSFEVLSHDGKSIFKNENLAIVSAPLDVLLTAERVGLNLLQRMCGIASVTAKYMHAVIGTGAVILDTRKTVPLLRPFDRYAVRMGGAMNHRYNLGDMILVKDNHLAANNNNIEIVLEKLQKFFQSNPRIPVELEVTSIEQFKTLMKYGSSIVDRVLFDNFQLDDLREAVSLNRGMFQSEASGGVTLSTVRSIAETGVQFISVGALTHSVMGLDISLEVE